MYVTMYKYVWSNTNEFEKYFNINFMEMKNVA